MKSLTTVFLRLFGAAASTHTQDSEWDMLINEATSLYQKGEYDRAVVVTKNALELAEKAKGPDHPDVATNLNDLALLYKSQGQYAQAEPLYKRSLAILEKAVGLDHPDVATSLNNLAALYGAPRPVREVRAALQAFAGNLGESLWPGSSQCSHEPEQPRGALPQDRSGRGSQIAGGARGSHPRHETLRAGL